MRRMAIALMMVGSILLPAGGAFAEYDVGGRWLLEGTGYAEKDILRVELEDEGYLDIDTETKDGVQYLTGYDVKVTLDASKMGINAWEYANTVTLQTPVKIPELDPTTDDFDGPFELPPVSVDGMTYQVTLKSITSGTIAIYGDLNVDTVGTVEINSESAIWKEGTEKPDIPDMRSGCNAGMASVFLLTLIPLAGLYRRKS